MNKTTKTKKRKAREFFLTKHIDLCNDSISCGVYYVAHETKRHAKFANIRSRRIIKVREVLPKRRKK